MVVVILEKVPASVRGELTRWMVELRTGVFVGDLSGMVRDKLWEMICGKVRKGAGMLVHNAASEQGFAIRFVGETSREVVDFDGLKLIRVIQKGRTAAGGEDT
ncbi:MAG TPA: type I-E CRISPR-associated endoribonuclease Cas2e [Blastocatellia bacterium]|nr:type I-E CRISPR-associated endoribonuclease Cas2e [Blastocatellia bacterium]